MEKSLPGCEALPLGRTPALLGGELHKHCRIQEILFYTVSITPKADKTRE